jgi:hypothetical protein
MFKIHSVTGRMFIGVLIGFAYGTLVLLLAPLFNFSAVSPLGLGTLMLFTMMGFTIGLVGIFDYHPVFGFKMRWWIRGIVGGCIFGLMYVFIGYESIDTIMHSSLMMQFGLHSPFWALTDYVLAGLIMAFLETKFAGEGTKLSLK